MFLETLVSFQGEIKMAEKAFETEELEETFMIICRGEVLLFNKLCPCSPYKSLFLHMYFRRDYKVSLQRVSLQKVSITKGINSKWYRQQKVSIGLHEKSIKQLM